MMLYKVHNSRLSSFISKNHENIDQKVFMIKSDMKFLVNIFEKRTDVIINEIELMGDDSDCFRMTDDGLVEGKRVR